MAPAASSDERVGPPASFIEVAKPYLLQSAIERRLSDLNMSDAREDAVRLQGVAWIDSVRRSLQLPVRTFNTAVVYFHKFRSLHADNEYNWADASAAALFTACKIEDTLKKSRDILCASWNLKLPVGEHLAPDDPRFENPSKLIIGLERLMLESAGFDFRNRHPQKLLVKLARTMGFGVEREARTAWNLCLDLYRTFAPLKQTAATMAIACIELAARLHDSKPEELVDRGPMSYDKWKTSRAEVMETLLDLLDLYTHHRTATAVGPFYPLETFIDIRIRLNQEASAANIPRFAAYIAEASWPRSTNGSASKLRNGIDTASPLTPVTPGTTSPSAMATRGHGGTVRFMLDAARARHERAEYDKYHEAEEEEYEVEIAVEPEVSSRGR
ncbi:cyclin-like protein [Westerdykella ornata]|uniref:RNA polymerase II holoenzyme cyclin-like subunit n=1 Tax=Westerdykella ornata TaxID=318751 RepID=A0A6A6JRL1_WESOR|nr:cyclin-like protein [Westerdykella ornata]KAF2279202.1 cyclin-like protein [Westerdykella ornata]